MKLPLDLIQKAERESPSPAAIKEIQKRTALKSAITLDGPDRVERRRRMIASVAIENVVDAFERYVGKNDLLPINYLSLGYLQSRAVGRIRYFDQKEHKTAVASGFLISESLVITNHHVFPVQNVAEFKNLAKTRQLSSTTSLISMGTDHLRSHSISTPTHSYTHGRI
jgi:endonuclease G